MKLLTPLLLVVLAVKDAGETAFSLVKVLAAAKFLIYLL